MDLTVELAKEIVGADDGVEYSAVAMYSDPLNKGTDPFSSTEPLALVNEELAALASVRARLDAGHGNNLMKKYRDLEAAAKDEWSKADLKYRIAILGALLMSTGAKIRDDDMQRLCELAEATPSRENYALPLWDQGFRGPGKRQFLAALDNYKPGTPRDFRGPSCHNCGKIAADIGRPLLRCGGCTLAHAWFCDKVRHMAPVTATVSETFC